MSTEPPAATSSLADDADNELPAIEIAAKVFGFKLAFHDTTTGRIYAMQDWIIGVAKTDNARTFWNNLKRRVKKATGVELSSRCVQLPYKASNGRTYQMEYADAETLYYVAQRMDSETGIRDETLKYLAKAGVLVDEIRADPQSAAERIQEQAKQRDYRRLISSGFSPEEANSWIIKRDDGKKARHGIVRVWSEHGISDPRDFANLTNQVTEVAVGKTATALKKELAVTSGSLRDHLSVMELTEIGVTEYLATGLHVNRDSDGRDELSEDIEDTRPILDAARPEIEKAFSKKRPTRK